MATARPTVDVQAALKSATASMLLLNQSVGNPLPPSVSIVTTPSGPATVTTEGTTGSVLFVNVTDTEGVLRVGSASQTFTLGGISLPMPLSFLAEMISAPTVNNVSAGTLQKTLKAQSRTLLADRREKTKGMVSRVNRLRVTPEEEGIKSEYSDFLSQLLSDLGNSTAIDIQIEEKAKLFGFSTTGTAQIILQKAYETTFAESVRKGIVATNAINAAKCGGVAAAPGPGASVPAPAAAPAPAPAPAAATAASEAETKARTGNVEAFNVLKRLADSNTAALAAMRKLAAGGEGVPYNIKAAAADALKAADSKKHVGGARTRRSNRKNQKSRKSRK